MHAGIGRSARRPAAAAPQIMIAIVVTAAITALCALYLMKSYSEQMRRDMSIALRGIPAQQRDGCILSYASAKPLSRPARSGIHADKAI
jgi:hypothetical protein